MKNLKKLVSVIVTVAMLISSFAALSVSAANGNYDDVEQDSSFYKAIKVLSGLGVVKGDDEGNFNPKNDIKRSEMVALVCRAKGEEEVALSAGGSSFDDVAADHWAAGYIAWGVSSNIVNGVGDNKFDPDAPVKFQDAVVMVLRALGYDRIAQRAENGGYPTGYLKVASQRGVLAGAAFDAATPATREVVAQIIYNAMTTPIVDISYYAAKPEDDEYTIFDGKNRTDLRTLLTWTREIYKVKATVNETGKTDENLRKDLDRPQAELILESAYDYAWDEVLDYQTYGYVKGDEIIVYAGETEVADYLGYTVEAYIAENEDEDWELLAIVPDAKTTVTETLGNDADFDNLTFNTDNAVFEYYVNEDAARTTKIDVATDARVYYNGSYLVNLNSTTFNVRGLLLNDANVITFMGPKNDDYNKVFVTDYAYAQVDTVKADDLYVKFTSGGLTLDADERGNDSFVYNIYDANGNPITLADVNEDDIFNIVAPKVLDNGVYVDDLEEAPYMDIYVSNEVVEGYVDEEIIDGQTYKISGKEYDVVGGLDLDVSDEGVFYLTIDGLVYEADASATASRNYSFIAAYGQETSFGVATHQLKMFTAEGVLETYDVASSLRVFTGSTSTTYRRNDGGQDTFFAGAVFANMGAGYADQATANTAVSNRLVTYRTNASNEIIELRFAGTGAADFAVTSDTNAEYYDDTQVFGRFDLNENSKLFVAPVKENTTTSTWNVNEEDLEIADFASLEEDFDYPAYIYSFAKDDFLGAAVIPTDVTTALRKSHLAVVKTRSTGLDADGMSVDVYTFIQAGETITMAIDNDSTIARNAMTTGDVFRYAKNGEGEIKTLNVIYVAATRTFNAGTFGYGSFDANDFAIVYGKVTELKRNSMTIDTTPSVADDADNDLRFTINDDEANTYANIDEARLSSSKPSAAVKAYSSAANIKESFGSNDYYAVATINEYSKYADIVQIQWN